MTQKKRKKTKTKRRAPMLDARTLRELNKNQAELIARSQEERQELKASVLALLDSIAAGTSDPQEIENVRARLEGRKPAPVVVLADVREELQRAFARAHETKQDRDAQKRAIVLGALAKFWADKSGLHQYDVFGPGIGLSFYAHAIRTGENWTVSDS